MIERKSYDIKAARGETVDRTFRFKDDNGNPIDLTGSDVIFRAAYKTVALRKSVLAGTLVMRPTLGEVDLHLTSAETRLFPAGGLTAYDIERWIGGNEENLLHGFLVLRQGANDDMVSV